MTEKRKFDTFYQHQVDERDPIMLELQEDSKSDFDTLDFDQSDSDDDAYDDNEDEEAGLMDLADLVVSLPEEQEKSKIKKI